MEDTPKDAPLYPYEQSSEDLPSDPPPQRTWWLWLLLALFVGGFAVLAHYQQQALEQARTPSATQPLGSLADDPQLRLTSRYALGVYRLSKMGLSGLSGQSEENSDGSSEEMTESMLDDVESSAGTLVGQLRTVPVLAEIRGKEAALRRLEEVSGSISTAAPPPGERENAQGSGEEAATAASPESLEEDARVFRQIYQQGSGSLSQEQRLRLIERHHWYARLALEQGGDDSVSPNSDIWRTTVTLLTAGLGLLAAGAAGFVLMVAAILLFAKGHMRTRYRALRTQVDILRRPLLEVIVLFLPLLLTLTLIGEVLGQLLNSPLPLAAVLWGALLAPLWPLLRGVSWERLRKALGWHRGGGVGWEMLSGVGGYLAGLPVMGLGLVATVFISRSLGTQPSHPAAIEALSGSFWQVVQIYLLACVWAPVVEESIFRGALYSHLRLRYSGVVSALFTGTIFAAIHPQGLAALPVLGSIGFVLAMLREWRGSLIAPMTAHALNNFLAITTVLLLFR